ncbi:hypothetical protein [Paraburkholderia aromaticivorans]|uniref:hypothetical protein n=1 Tax=Paraburkholderia aromaticivorans TaxID=2026199 RepID=UPI0038BBCD88
MQTENQTTPEPKLKVYLKDEKFGRTKFHVCDDHRDVTGLAKHDADMIKDNRGYVLHLMDCKTIDEAIDKMKWLGLTKITELN